MSAYSVVTNGNVSTVTVFENGEVLVADNSHPNYTKIVEGVQQDIPVTHLFNIAKSVIDKFEKVSDRVALAGGTLFFDGDPIENELTEQILRFMEQDLDFKPLVKFWEKLAQNPEPHSREQLFSWLRAHAFTIDNKGNIIAYKGVVDKGNGNYTSISSGPAIVDGVAVNGQVPQKVGSTVEIARSRVEFNPEVGCSSGLHAGTWTYARDFARGAVLTVKIHPRDVVSVPTDCGAQKMRVSRYKVTGVTEVELPILVEDDDEYSDCEYCDCEYCACDN